MEESILCSLLDDAIFRKWREIIEKKESETWFFASEQETLESLKAELNEKNRKLLTSYSLAIENRMDCLHYNLKLKALNLGIKIGMELQKAFAEFEEPGDKI